jgi:hypothetical protein
MNAFTWPAIVFWILIAISFAVRGPLLLLYLFYILGSFGTLVMVPGNIVGGANLLPQSVCALFLVAKLLLRPNAPARVAALALDPQRLGVLALFLLWGLLTAYAMPRLFAGRVDVVPINAFVPDPQPLSPTAANITQSAYMFLSTAMVFAFAITAGEPSFRRHFLRANLVGAIVVIITGIVDLATQGTELLAPFRNATYALLTDVEILGSKRVVGLMPEASTYGSLCVGFLSTLVFLRPSFEPPSRQVFVPLVIFGLFAVALLSTSSTAYVGLIILAAAYGLSVLRRLKSPSPASRLGLISELAFLTLAAFVLLGIYILDPTMFDPFSDMVDTLVFQKTATASYIERAAWTRSAWEAFLGTDGLGVGLGGARTSNWYVSILSNTGLIGGVLMGIFILQCLLRRAPKNTASAAEMLTGLKFSLLPTLVMSAVSGTTPDFGAASAAVFGTITALSSNTVAKRQQEAWRLPPRRLGRGTSS